MNIIIKNLSKFICPYIFIFMVYIQLNGESSPGGGFQAGVILASLMVSFNFASIFPRVILALDKKTLIITACSGVVLYCAVGCCSLIFDSNYLNYGFISNIVNVSPISCQNIGIILVELGIGVCVFSVMYLIFLIFDNDY